MKSTLKRGWLPALIAAVLLGGLLLLRLAWPPLRYGAAEWLTARGRYELAEQFYEGLTYRDAAEKRLECAYRLADGLFEAGDYPMAEAAFRELGEYKSALVKADLCRLAGLSGPEERLTELFVALDGQQTEQELQQLRGYIRASLLLAGGELETALPAFQALGDYRDSAEQAEACRDAALQQARTCMKQRDFEGALELFSLADRGEESAREEAYCRLRLEKPTGEPLIRAESLEKSFAYGDLYHSHGTYFYVPRELDENSGVLVYFSGGFGEPMLYVESMYEYLYGNDSSALLLFRENSGMPDMEEACREMVDLAEQAAADCGICVQDLVLAGSSNGGYTALTAAGIFSEQDFVVPRKVLSFDTELDWRPRQWPSEEQRVLLGRAGTAFYFFEQPGDLTSEDLGELLSAAGCPVTWVICSHDEHNVITEKAFSLNVFSWAFDETRGLDAGEYRQLPIGKQREWNE